MRVTTAQIEEALDAVMAEVERELWVPRERRTAQTYERLAALHHQEASYWKDYLEMSRSRVAWMAAGAAADRAHQLSERYARQAVALLQDLGELWPSEHTAWEAA
ncbi:MAG: hypothetical protein ACRD2X_18120 [Vicinamibacteraceae bacterium]